MSKQTTLGLRENWQQFTLLVIINAFVGGMVGMERTVLPVIAETEFHIAAKTAIFSFIIVFGIVKAFSNYYAGILANRIGRKNVLTIGWLLGLPVPFILIWAPDWSWIVAANVLLGIHQGLSWSSTVVMKIDIVGERNRGLAMGLNEAAGYLAVGAVAFLTGWLAATYGARPYPFYIGIVLSVLGLLFTLLFVKDTRQHVALETAQSAVKHQKGIFWQTTIKNPNLSAITQAGFVNNLNDGMVWGLLPLLLTDKGFGIEDVGVIVSIYPIVWGIGQLGAGALADLYVKKWLLFWGMLLQGIVLASFALLDSYWGFIALSAALGIGTALVYPTFLAAIADYTHPQQRAESIGVFRLWRDMGYAFGAILTGIIADVADNETAIVVVGLLTVGSAMVIWRRMKV